MLKLVIRGVKWNDMMIPNFKFEKELIKKGYQFIAGVDEAGAGALAGPVVAAAVVFSGNIKLPGIQDSKKITAKKREELLKIITTKALFYGIGVVDADQIDKIGIRPANYLAMKKALIKCKKVDFALIDAWTLPDLPYPQKGIVKGDQKIKSIAAASILAKVYRDRLMIKWAREYPQYFFDQHKGYGTKLHFQALNQYGPCPIHRQSFNLGLKNTL